MTKGEGIKNLKKIDDAFYERLLFTMQAENKLQWKTFGVWKVQVIIEWNGLYMHVWSEVARLEVVGETVTF